MTTVTSAQARTDHSSGAVEGSFRPMDAAPENAGKDQISPIRKAAIVLVSLEQSLASQILAYLDRASVEAVTWEIARLERIDPSEQEAVLDEFLGQGLRRLCFVFEDLLRMSGHDVRAGYHPEDVGIWALALAGAAAPVRAKVYSALDADSASSLQEFLEGMGPFRLSDAEAAQAQLADQFRRLHDHGSLCLPDPSGRDELLV